MPAMQIKPELVTQHEAREVLHSYGEAGVQPGSFGESLIETIKLADPVNTGKLATVFPSYVNAIRMVDAGQMEALKMIADPNPTS